MAVGMSGTVKISARAYDTRLIGIELSALHEWLTACPNLLIRDIAPCVSQPRPIQDTFTTESGPLSAGEEFQEHAPRAQKFLFASILPFPSAGERSTSP